MQEGTIRIEMMMYWGSLALGYCLRLYGTFTSLSQGGVSLSLQSVYGERSSTCESSSRGVYS